MGETTWSPTDLLRAVSAPTDWRAVSDQEAAELWPALRGWVEWFKDRFALDHRVVPPCWYLHGALVDLLTALRDHHEYAFTDVQPATAASEWQRVFRDLEPRLRDWASRTGCTRDVHRPDVTMEWADDTVRWEQHVRGDEQMRRAGQPEQLIEGAVAPGAPTTDHAPDDD